MAERLTPLWHYSSASRGILLYCKCSVHSLAQVFAKKTTHTHPLKTSMAFRQPQSFFFLFRRNLSLAGLLTFPPPTHHHVHLRSFASEGTSDSGSGGGGELPGQAGVGHCQTAERGGRCSAGAGQQRHQAASTAAASGKDGHWVAPLMTGAKPDFRKYVPLYLKLVLTTHMICSYLSLKIQNRFNMNNYQAVTVLRADWGWEKKNP